jgi:hypothetical protein
MWELDDGQSWLKVAHFEMPWAFTYADTRPGHTDPEKREKIRGAAGGPWPYGPETQHWAFRITVRKSGSQRFDIENVPKLIIDAFCKRQLRDDKSRFPHLALYEDDTIDHVIGLQVNGERTVGPDSTLVEIFARRANR